MVSVRADLTIEQFLLLPERKPALEYEDGVVTQKMSPKGQHSTLQFDLAQRFNAATIARRLARAYPELRMTFAGRSVVPDVSVYLWDRIPRTPDGEVENDFFLPPDIAVEIVSPRQSVTTLVRRCLWYVVNGVRIALLVDPDDRSILVFRPGGQSQAHRGHEAIDFGDVLPGFQLTPADLFAALRLT